MIPKKIHQIVGPTPSPLITKCMNSWLPIQEYGYEIIKWNDDSLLDFISKEYPFALQPFENARNYAEASDIARYLLIYHYGGYYFDWDIRLLRIDKFLELADEYDMGFIVQDPVNQTLASEAFSAQKGEDFLYKIVENIETIYTNQFRESFDTPR